MSTRAFIGFVTDDLIQATYSHYDGYPAGVGSILECFYSTATQAQEITNTRTVECVFKDSAIRPFDSGEQEEGPLLASWEEFVLEVAYSDVQYAYLFVPEHSWIGAEIHRDWKNRIREAPSKKDSIQSDKLTLKRIRAMWH